MDLLSVSQRPIVNKNIGEGRTISTPFPESYMQKKVDLDDILIQKNKHLVFLGEIKLVIHCTNTVKSIVGFNIIIVHSERTQHKELF